MSNGYYIYVLIDPRNNKILSIDKGIGNNSPVFWLNERKRNQKLLPMLLFEYPEYQNLVKQGVFPDYFILNRDCLKTKRIY